MSQPTGVQRPTGVTVLAILSAIAGVVLLLFGLGAIGFGGVVAGAAGATVGGLLVIAGLFGIVVGAINLIFAYGAWNLRPWAWVLGVVGAGLSIVQSILTLVAGGSVSGQVLNVIIAAIILYYLNTPAVRRAFGRGPGQYFQQ